MRPAPRLFTPGPLCTSPAVRAAAGVDLGSRTPAAVALTARLRAMIAAVAGSGDACSVVPLQGSGTFAVEAMLCSVPDAEDHLLIVENGAYSARMTEICAVHGIRHSVLRCDHTRSFDLARVEARLLELGDVTHVAAVHFETALGVLNDIDGLGALAARHGARLLVDAISTFGALPLDVTSGRLAAVALSANKCLHGLPGLSFVIADRATLARPSRPRTLSLDLRAQHRSFEADGQWRFTPPLQAMLALEQAIREYEAAGGREARFGRYAALADRLVRGMAALGFLPLIDQPHRAPIIITFAPRPDAACDAAALAEALAERGLVIYPSKHWRRDSFRVGVIGAIGEDDIDDLLAAIGDYRAAAGQDRHRAVRHET